MIWAIFLIALAKATDESELNKCLVDEWPIFAKEPVAPEKNAKMILAHCSNHATLVNPSRITTDTLKLHQLRSCLASLFESA